MTQSASSPLYLVSQQVVAKQPNSIHQQPINTSSQAQAYYSSSQNNNNNNNTSRPPQQHQQPFHSNQIPPGQRCVGPPHPPPPTLYKRLPAVPMRTQATQTEITAYHLMVTPPFSSAASSLAGGSRTCTIQSASGAGPDTPSSTSATAAPSSSQTPVKPADEDEAEVERRRAQQDEPQQVGQLGGARLMARKRIEHLATLDDDDVQTDWSQAGGAGAPTAADHRLGVAELEAECADNLNASLLALSCSSNSSSSVSLVGHDSALADTLQCDLRIGSATVEPQAGASVCATSIMVANVDRLQPAPEQVPFSAPANGANELARRRAADELKNDNDRRMVGENNGTNIEPPGAFKDTNNAHGADQRMPLTSGSVFGVVGAPAESQNGRETASNWPIGSQTRMNMNSGAMQEAASGGCGLDADRQAAPSPPSLSEASSQTDASLASSRMLDRIGRALEGPLVTPHPPAQVTAAESGSQVAPWPDARRPARVAAAHQSGEAALAAAGHEPNLSRRVSAPGAAGPSGAELSAAGRQMETGGVLGTSREPPDQLEANECAQANRGRGARAQALGRLEEAPNGRKFVVPMEPEGDKDEAFGPNDGATSASGRLLHDGPAAGPEFRARPAGASFAAEQRRNDFLTLVDFELDSAAAAQVLAADSAGSAEAPPADLGREKHGADADTAPIEGAKRSSTSTLSTRHHSYCSNDDFLHQGLAAQVGDPAAGRGSRPKRISFAASSLSEREPCRALPPPGELSVAAEPGPSAAGFGVTVPPLGCAESEPGGAPGGDLVEGTGGVGGPLGASQLDKEVANGPDGGQRDDDDESSGAGCLASASVGPREDAPFMAAEGHKIAAARQLASELVEHEFVGATEYRQAPDEKSAPSSATSSSKSVSKNLSSLGQAQRQDSSEPRASPSPPTTVSELDEELSTPSFVDSYRQRVDQVYQLADTVASGLIGDCCRAVDRQHDGPADSGRDNGQLVAIDELEAMPQGQDAKLARHRSSTSSSTGSGTTSTTSVSANSYICAGSGDKLPQRRQVGGPALARPKPPEKPAHLCAPRLPEAVRDGAVCSQRDDKPEEEAKAAAIAVTATSIAAAAVLHSGGQTGELPAHVHQAQACRRTDRTVRLSDPANETAQVQVSITRRAPKR